MKKTLGCFLGVLFISLITMAQQSPLHAWPDHGKTGISPPYQEDFNGVTEPDLPPNWHSIVRHMLGHNSISTRARIHLAVSPPNLVSMDNSFNRDFADPDGELLFISPELNDLSSSIVRFFASTGDINRTPSLIVGTMSDPTDATTFVPVQTLTDLPYIQFQEYLVGFPNAGDDARHVAFRHGLAHTGPTAPIYLDQFSYEAAAECEQASNLQAFGLGPNSVRFQWAENGTATQWQIKYGPPGFNVNAQGNAIQVTGTTDFVYNHLSAHTSYEYYVRAVCGEGLESHWAGPAYFRTTQEMGSVPFFENFEGASANAWGFENGQQLNQWHVGNATAYAGNRSAYISNNEGVSIQYTLNPPSRAWVHLYRDLSFPAEPGTFTLKYMLKGRGQAMQDYLRVHLLPVHTPPHAGEGLSIGTIKGNQREEAHPNWTQITVPLPNSLAGGNYRLVFSWTYNTSGGNQPPHAIDNVQVTYEPHRILTGTVRGPDGQAVADARIAHGLISATTNQQGFFSIPDIPLGTYTFDCEAGGYATVSREITVGKEKSMTLDFQFEQEVPGLPGGFGLHGTTPLPAAAIGFRQSATDGRYLFVPGMNNILYVFDMINPSSVQTVATRTIANLGRSFFHNGRLYTGIGEQTVNIYDVSQASNPSLLGSFNIYGELLDMKFDGDLAFLVSRQSWQQSTLRVVDIGNPTDIREISVTVRPFGEWADMAIQTEGKRLSVLGRTTTNNSTLYIYTYDGSGVLSERSSIPITVGLTGMAQIEDYLVVAAERTLFVYHVGNPSSPVLRLTQALPSSLSTEAISANQGVILLQTWQFGLRGMQIFSYVYDSESNVLHRGMSYFHADGWSGHRFMFLSDPIGGGKGSETDASTHKAAFTYAIESGNIWGSYAYPQRIIRYELVDDEEHSLTMIIQPQEAADDGCEVEPEVGTHVYPRPTLVSISAKPATGWHFHTWIGAPGGNPSAVMVEGDVEVTGVFGPVLDVSGTTQSRWFCPCDAVPPDRSEIIPAGVVRFTAGGDDWRVMGFTIAARGSGDDVADIDTLIVYTDEVIYTKYPSDNGSVRVSISPPLYISKNQTRNIPIAYVFGFDPWVFAADTLQGFGWTISGASVSAEPVNHEPGLIQGNARMHDIIFGRVYNETNYFTRLDDAVKATPPGGIVTLCPGEHQANIILDKPMTIKGREGELPNTFLRPADPSLPLFILRRGTGKSVFEHITITE